MTMTVEYRRHHLSSPYGNAKAEDYRELVWSNEGARV